jgi:hypothetical protein
VGYARLHAIQISGEKETFAFGNQTQLQNRNLALNSFSELDAQPKK